MKPSLKTDQVSPDQLSKTQLSKSQLTCPYKSIKQMDNSPNRLFFRPNLFNLVALVVCFSFYLQINQLEDRIQQLESNCPKPSNGHLKTGLNTLNNLDALKENNLKDSLLPLSIVEFVDQRIETLAHNRTKRDINHHCNCPPGPPGKRGKRGKKGDVGAIGPSGAVGFPGPMGEKGEKGDTGVDVFTTTKNGVKRSVTRLQGGAMGYAEFIAIKGLANLGITISPGDLLLLKGEPGSPGLPGPPGNNGEKGEIGQPGLPGEAGPAGPPGFAGPKGDKGERGLTTTMDGGSFPTGFIEGPPGPPGPPGPAGKKGESTPGSPGQKGDKGDKGDKGERGKRGRKGAVGLPGAKGKAGDVGDKGDKGLCGDAADLRGLKGEPGDIGRPGMIGPPGMPGPPGPKGDKGDLGQLNSKIEPLPPAGYLKDYAGDSQVIYIPGPPGQKGDQGDPGKLGMPGARGPPGQSCIMSKGIKGQKGDSGVPGLDAPCPLDPDGLPIKGCGYRNTQNDQRMQMDQSDYF